MLLTNSQIQIFSTVIAAGGFAPAAKILNLDPSTVSKTVRNIEEELGTKLVERSTRSFSVTPEGHILADACVVAIRAVEKAMVDISLLKQDIRGRLRVFASSTVAEYRIAPLMGRFHEAYPDVSIDFIIRNGYTDPIEAGMDIALSHEPPTRKDYVMRRISDTRMVLVGSPMFLERYGAPRDVDDVINYPCISSTVDIFNTWSFEQDGETRAVSIHGGFRASTGAMMLELARQGLGLANLARASIIDELRRGELVMANPPGAKPVALPLYAVYHDRRLLNGRIRAFVDFLAKNLDEPTL